MLAGKLAKELAGKLAGAPGCPWLAYLADHAMFHIPIANSFSTFSTCAALYTPASHPAAFRT
jgi:hypothetical protein